MKSIVIIFLGCLGAVCTLCSASGVNVGEVIKQISELHVVHGTNPRLSIFILADLYIYLNRTSVTDEKSRQTKALYLTMLDTFAHWIAKDEPKIYIKMLSSSKNLMNSGINHMIHTSRQNLWNAEFDQSQVRESTYDEIEQFFRDQISTLVDKRRSSSEIIIKALIDGTGFCDIFNHYLKQGIELEANEKFSKIVYLLKEFLRHNLIYLLDDQITQVLAIQRLEKSCTKLLERGSLDDERQKALLFAILYKQLEEPIAPVAELESYVVGNSTDLCERLVLNGNLFISTARVLNNVGSVFMLDCLNQLAERLPRALEQDQLRMKMFAVVVNSPWFRELESLAQGMNGLEKDVYLSYFFDTLANDNPEIKIILTEKNNICELIRDGEFVAISEQYDFIEKAYNWDELKLLLETRVDMKNLNKFSILHKICSNYQ